MSKTNSFGYKEELSRSMSSFSSFAVSFSLMSVLTGIFANFNLGYHQAGGAIAWTWLLVAVGQLFVALVMANLAIQFPIAGYGYQWAARLVNTDFGFFVGWLLLIQFITGFPGICETFTVTLVDLLEIQISETSISIITVVVISLVTLIHLFGIQVAAKVNDLGVYAEMIGVVLVILFLMGIWIVSGNASVENLYSATKLISEKSMHFSSFALSLLLGAWGLTGFEAAADLAEETKSPTTSVPRAVLLSLITSAISGFFILVFLSVHAQGTNEGHQNLLIIILEKALGLRLTYALLLFVLISIFACAVASMATASRLLFSFSRDRIVPFSSWISIVGKKSKSPKNATIVIWLFSSIAILTLKQVEIISSVSALASYLGYAGIMLAVLLSPSGSSFNQGYFYSKQWRRPIQIIALLWTIFVIIALAYPETSVEGFETKHLPLISTSCAIGVGILLYFLYVRSRVKKGIAGPPPSTT